MDAESAQEVEIAALLSIFDGTKCFRLNKAGTVDDALISGELLAYPQISEECITINEGDISHNIKCLPPIALGFQLPLSYPQEAPPQYIMSCKWLTRPQLSKLCQKLDALWKEMEGSEILYRWIDFLQQDALKFLGIQSSLSLNADVLEDCELDDRATQDIGSQNLLFGVLVEYDKEQRLQEFNRSVFSCQVCFCEKEGLQCIRFHECSHVFCRDCMSSFFSIRIEEGDVKNLVCPIEKCITHAHPLQVKDLVSPALFEKYERLVLQSTLESMSDVAYCPRPSCQCPVLLEKDCNMGNCPSCYYVFCTMCKFVYHGIAPCRNKSENVTDLKAILISCTDEERKNLAATYGKQYINRLWADVTSSEWINANCQKCPECNTGIQKFDGCNKMTCTRCNCYFCWICLSVLSRCDPYKHFRSAGSRCQLFEVPIDDDDIQFAE